MGSRLYETSPGPSAGGVLGASKKAFLKYREHIQGEGLR